MVLGSGQWPQLQRLGPAFFRIRGFPMRYISLSPSHPDSQGCCSLLSSRNASSRWNREREHRGKPWPEEQRTGTQHVDVVQT